MKKGWDMAAIASAPNAAVNLIPQQRQQQQQQQQTTKNVDGDGDGNGKTNLALLIAIIVTSIALVLLTTSFSYYCYLRYKKNKKLPSPPSSSSSTSSSKALSNTNRHRYHHHNLNGNGGPVHTKNNSNFSNCSNVSSSNGGGGESSQVFTYKQMQIATNNFSNANELGQGGFGNVYRGILSEDGRFVAIKQLDRGGKQGDREFRVEVDMLSRLSSPYLLELIGYCADQEHRLLVYEFMPNGSLQQHLCSDGSNGRPPTLDWGTRMKISLDAARGLEYLHELVTPSIIHRDFKSSNVLLDENFNAKVSDFGLAKLASDKIGGHVSTRVLGTHGYVAPEYALTGHLTTKSDVYSYGVVLLELLTGRVPVDMKRPAGEGILVSWALSRLTDRNKLFEIIDPQLKGQYAMKDMIQVAAIAAMCVQSEADYRPFMTDVVQSLIPLVKLNRPSRILSSPSFLHHTVTVKSSSIDSASSG